MIRISLSASGCKRSKPIREFAIIPWRLVFPTTVTFCELRQLTKLLIRRIGVPCGIALPPLDPRFTPPSHVAGHGIPAEIVETAKIGITEFLEHQEVGSVDFVKVDTDGSELEVLLSAEKSIESRQILGFMVECLYQGSDHETSNTFHNIDRFMKRHGFMVYSMAVHKYSRAALPAPFVYSFPAQTTWGQALWGDVVFLRDLGAPSQPTPELSVEKIIKLACLYEIFCVPDCAAEMILQRRERIAARVDPGTLLDLLTPPLSGGALTYRAYLDAVAANPRMLFPAE